MSEAWSSAILPAIMARAFMGQTPEGVARRQADPRTLAPPERPERTAFRAMIISP
jgi:hypothetical protein